MSNVQTSLLLTTLILLMVWASCRGKSVDATASEIEQSLKRELPVGSRYEVVEAYLQKSKMEYSWVESEHAFFAIVRRVGDKTSSLGSKNIKVVLYMDDQRRLKAVKVEPVYTGL